MKTLITVALFLSGLQLMAQSTVIEKGTDQDRIQFSVSREANIRYYVVEGANDSINFEIINTVPSEGNTVHARTYVFDITEKRFSNYRVKQIDYSGSTVTCQYIFAPKTRDIIPDKTNLRTLSIR